MNEMQKITFFILTSLFKNILFCFHFDKDLFHNLLDHHFGKVIQFCMKMKKKITEKKKKKMKMKDFFLLAITFSFLIGMIKSDELYFVQGKSNKIKIYQRGENDSLVLLFFFLLNSNINLKKKSDN